MRTFVHRRRRLPRAGRAALLTLLVGSASAQSLIHHWRLDGDATDAVGSADGTENGGMTYAVGQFGQAASLDGADDFITTAAGALVPITDCTLTAWVFWDDGDDRGRIAGGQSGGSEGEVFSLSRSTAVQGGTDRKLFLNLLPNGGQGGSITESADSTISIGTWMHVAYTVDSTNGTTIYLNGAPVGTNPTRTTHTPATNFAIGGRADAAQDFFDGLMDEVAIFSGVLDAAQLSNVMSFGAENFDAPPQVLLSHWKLDETSGQTAADSAGASPGTLGISASAETEDPTVNQPGVFGTAYRFDTVDLDRVDVPNFAPFGGFNTGSICGWFKKSSATRGAVLSYGEGTSSSDRLVVELQDTGVLRLVIRENNSNLIELQTTATYLDDVWHHFAWVQDGSGVTLYLDGAEVTSFGIETNGSAWFDSVTNVGQMTLGYEARTGGVQLPFGGSVDDIAIFSRPITTQELANIISSGAESYDTDATAPTITALSPDGDTGVYPASSLVATFSENIVLTGLGTITITDTDDGSGTQVISLPDAGQVTVAGNTLTVNPSTNLEFGANFEVVISADAIEDGASPPNSFAGTSGGQWTFSVAAEDLSAPVITLKSPLDDAIDVSRASDIVATFDDPILVGSGNIVIKDLFDDSTTQTIAVTDPSQVSVSGNVLTIDPSTLLSADRAYAVQIDAGAVKNYTDVGFGGISNADVTTWNFQTRELSPNVVFILGDDQAWYDYSFMRRPSVEQTAINMNPSIYQVAETPAIDSLADQGIVFTHGYTPPICRPSLASMVTGAYPHQTLITGNDPASGPDTAVEDRMQVMNPLPRTLADELGYTSFQTGKWWEGDFANGGFTHGDTVNSTAGGTEPPQWSGGKPGYVTARHGDWGLMAGRVDYVNDVAAPASPIPYANTIQTATDFIDAQVTGEQPFFLWYAPFLPHTPHDPPTGLISKYDALISEPNETGDYFAKYYANIERFDGGVGALLDHLDTAGIADNTIVVLICDNGWINRDNASAYDARSKQTPYQGGIRTPIIVRWPDQIKAGGAIEPQIVTTPVSVVDLAPTVLGALDLVPTPEMTGLDLLDLGAVGARDTVFTEDSSHDIADLNDPSQSLESRVAIRDGWKLILFTTGVAELYHLFDASTGNAIDPFETNDLSASNPGLVNELTAAIVNWYSVGTKTFATWIGDPGFGLAGGDQGFDLDPDGDNLANGLESWFGTHPGEFNPGLASVEVTAGNLSFTHPISPNPPTDLVGYYEWSPNLTDWYAGDGIDGPGGGLTVTISSVIDNSTATVTAAPSQPVPSIFVRAGVVQP
ncbi:sulfatase-like hydrolase/transferase [Haloferula helveola]